MLAAVCSSRFNLKETIIVLFGHVRRRNHSTFSFPKGIFAYLNYQVPRTRKEICETLVTGLQRLEYRGYDSAGNMVGLRELPRMHTHAHTDLAQKLIVLMDSTCVRKI